MPRRFVRAAALAGAVLAGASAATAPAAAATFAVDSAEDAIDAAPGDGSCASVLAGAACTLRAAVQEANALPGPDRVDLPAGTFPLAIAGGGEELAATGDLDVTEDLEVVGASEALTIVDGASLDRIFDVSGATTATLRLASLTLRHGLASVVPRTGGCVRIGAAAALELDRVTFFECRAFDGGAIGTAGSIAGADVTFLANSGPPGQEDGGQGGAISQVGPGANLALARALFADNLAQTGGGIHAVGSFSVPERATIFVSDSTFTGNFARQFGGAVLGNSTTDLVFENVTMSGNDAGFGGAIGNDGGCTFSLRNSTITDNSASIGGGISEVHFSAALIELRNTILAGNHSPSGPDCNFRFHSDGGSLVGSLAGCDPTLTATDLVGVDPLLAPLAFAHPGDRTPVHALLPGSPAIDGGQLAFCPAADQLGFPRPLDGDSDGVADCDIGAIEVPSASLFADGFEGGTPDAWSDVAP